MRYGLLFKAFTYTCLQTHIQTLILLLSTQILLILSSYPPHMSTLSYPRIYHTSPPYLILLSTTLLIHNLSSYPPHSSTILIHTSTTHLKPLVSLACSNQLRAI